MMNYDYYLEKVKEEFSKFGKKGEERLIHSIGVSNSCAELVKHYKPDDTILLEKARIAGIIHDYAKFLSFEEYEELLKKHNVDLKLDRIYNPIYHGYVGYLYIEDKLDIHDKEILDAIIYHSTGRSNMTFLDKVLFIADYIEPNRVGDFFEKIRSVAFVDLDLACFYEAKATYDYLKGLNREIFYETVNAYNYYKNIIENR